ncbi:MAG: hypothetical protein GY751_05040 [Bacteroidetes bacterium]|nr:hypothetical protein [Bacteroidota bacterium]
MIERKIGSMVFLKHEVKPRPYWIVEWSMDAAIGAGSIGGFDTFWVIDSDGNSKSVDEDDLTNKPCTAVFGDSNER